jgi:endoglucanase
VGTEPGRGLGRGRGGRTLGWVRATLVVAVLIPGVPALTPSASQAASSVPPQVRVDQIGYPAASAKAAYLMSPHSCAGTDFSVITVSGTVVTTGSAGPSQGSWNRRYRYVCPLTFDAVTAPGTYRVAAGSGVSPPFVVAPASSLWVSGLSNSVSFYANQRDGSAYLPSALRTAPAHLADSTAVAYLTPTMNSSGGFSGDLAPAGATLDASGGWWDAGDYLKFVQTSSYTVDALGVGVRDFAGRMGAGAGNANMVAEFRFGIDWLEKMWDDPSRTLYYQVGIATGNAGLLGDHDLWRLPQADDTYGGTDPTTRYIRHRPVLRAGPPGTSISPNLAGRLAAAFGLCAQIYAATDSAYAARCLADGEHIYALADTAPTGPLLTAAPFGFYPETQWRDDLELGATELARAVPSGGSRSNYLADAASWASAYLASTDRDTLNLYDVGGLAHYELAKTMSALGSTGLAVTPARLTSAIGAQVQGALDTTARTTPFRFGYPWSSTDTVSHGAGLVVMAAEYDALTGTATYAPVAQGWLDNILGANPWGVSFIVGDGTVFPRCMQHQVANLIGSLDGMSPVLAGATVEGPTRSASRGTLSGMRICPGAGGDRYSTFNGHHAVYRDKVQSYTTDEPAIDLAAATPLAFAWLSSPST